MVSSLRNSHVLVTGGTGSFGKRFATTLRSLAPGRISIFSRDEKKQYDMRQEYPDFRYFLGDVRDQESVRRAVKGVDFVFHAAALKQVPSCEEWPIEAVRTNVLGSSNVFEAAAGAGVKVVVALSTDKAVKPVNAMGMTKALMEKLVSQFHRQGHQTRFCAVRYGNVLGSRGSVLPVFKAQIQRKGQVTLTNPDMTRFLLTLDEAIDLVLFAMSSGEGGEVFVRKAPACTVKRLAEAAVMLFGEKREIAFRTVGARIGEKVHEVLVSEAEAGRAEDRGEYFVIPPEQDGETSRSDAVDVCEYTSENTERIDDVNALVSLLSRAGLESEG